MTKSAAKHNRSFKTRLKVTQKIVLGYLVLSLFSIVAILVALFNIQQHVAISERLVNNEFQAVSLIRDLRQNLLAQERLEQQHLILKDDEMLSLLANRHSDFKRLWETFLTLDLQETRQLETPVGSLLQKADQALLVLKTKSRQNATHYIDQNITSLREFLDHQLELIAEDRERIIDDSLQKLNEDSARAFQLTLASVFLGITIGGGVAYRVVQSISQSISNLRHAAREAAEGRFTLTHNPADSDEFGALAKEFMIMGQKLIVMQKRLLDANPLTHLPGNLTIEAELKRRILNQEPFAHIYIDLDHFKAYNDRYGYQKGSDVIAMVANIIKDVTGRLGNPEDLVGHIGGDDYLVLSTPDKAEEIARETIQSFEKLVPEIYSKEDLAAGFYEGTDRFGEKRRHPLMSMSIAVICSGNLVFPTIQEIGEECAKMKHHLKNLTGSNYLVDRRRR